MRFPNAFRGVKKIWLAELLELLAYILYLRALAKGRKMLAR